MKNITHQQINEVLDRYPNYRIETHQSDYLETCIARDDTVEAIKIIISMLKDSDNE